jgi:flagellar motor switch protein FliN/FliY
MPHAAILKWVLNELANGFASVLEAMAGVRPAVEWEILTAAPPLPEGELFRWQQPFTGLPGEIHLLGTQADGLAIGNQVMLGAGIEDSSPDELRSTFLESMGQAFSVLARAMTSRLGQEVVPTNGHAPDAAPAPGVLWGSIQLSSGDVVSTLWVGFPPQMLDAFEPEPLAAQAAAASGGAGSAAVSLPVPVAVDDTRTFELLLDVELPVSVSFGHADVPLKDVLKLTTGSIVELSRAIVEPVDVVVNNCVIARGEVVVVEGNFGVRIQHVVSRSERLRTLQ